MPDAQFPFPACRLLILAAALIAGAQPALTEAAESAAFPAKPRWSALGAEPASTSPAELDRLIAEEIATYSRIARTAGIKPQ